VDFPRLPRYKPGMSDLEISAALVGRMVVNPGRPEWGSGTVLRVQTTTVGGKVQHRVSVQFVTGHRTLIVPPARLVEPQTEPERQAGWLDQIAGRTLDDQLAKLPEHIEHFLGTPAQRIAALAPLYAFDEEPAALIRWARRHANVADPLSLWSRDELLVSFRRFCLERDSTLRIAAAQVKAQEGFAAVEAILAAQAPRVAEGMWAALRRPI
jgi:hypothetical protein